MSPTLIDFAPAGDEWLHEIKDDGYRTQVHIANRSARAFTRNGRDWSDKYAPIVTTAGKLKCRSAILDGELIVQDEQGRSDYHGLRKAIGTAPFGRLSRSGRHRVEACRQPICV